MKHDHTLDKLTKQCDGIYNGDSLLIISCSCPIDEETEVLYTK